MIRRRRKTGSAPNTLDGLTRRGFLAVGIGAVIGLPAFADNAITTENQKPGTTAWQIGLPPYQNSNDTDQWIRGYASAVSINKGDTITFNITVNPYSWKTGPVPFYIDVYRVGWYGGAGGRLMLHLGPFTGVQQPGGTSAGGVTSPGPTYDPSTGMITCQWTGDGMGNGSYTLDTSQPTLSGSADWTSGIYLALLSTSQSQYGPTTDPDHQTYIIFTIREDTRSSAILFQQAVATYQAYNNYPNDRTSGKSTYDADSYGALTNLSTVRAVKVSFDRPYTYSDHTGAGDFLKWELYFVRWLERNGYDVTYATDVDVHVNGASFLLSHSAVVVAGHAEYWSAQMRTAWESARDSGTSLGFFGANSIYSQIRFEPSPYTGVANRVLVAYKDPTLDPYNNPSNSPYTPALTTVPWRNDPVNQPEQQTLGTMYADYFPATNPADPYIVQNSSNWMYANTGFTNGASVPGILGYEMDQQFPNSVLPSATPGSYQLLSVSPFVGVNESSNANSSIYQASAGPGAWVFNAGSIYWSLALDDYTPPAGINTGSVPAPSAGIQTATANFLATATATVTPPAAPTALTATEATSTSINLAWTNNAYNATAVLVERSPDNVTFAQIASLGSTLAAYADSGLTPNTQYYYRVRAQDGQTYSGYSNTATATTSAPPPAPSGLAATVASETSISLLWINNGTTATSVLVERSTDGTTFVQIASLAATVTTYTDTGLTTSTVYYYRVRAENTSGYSPYSSVVSATAGALAAPTGLTATPASSSTITLNWTNNAYSDSYVGVERSTDNVTFTQVTYVPITTPTYTSGGLAAGTLYYFRVYAQNYLGVSPFSNTASATTQGPPAAPSGLTATAASASSINLAWTDNAANATAILVEQSTDNTTFTQIASLAATAAAYTVTGLNSDMLYYFRVRAENSSGYSAYSGTASATTQGVPSPPTGLTAAVQTSTSVSLAWTNATTNTTAVLVESSTDNVTFTQIASLGPTTSTYTATGLQAGTTYYFRVRAQDSSGYSAYSNTVTITAGPPASPINVAAADSSTSPSTQINVSWKANSNNQTGFLVFHSTNNKTFTQIASVAASVSTYTDTGLKASTTYYYYVEATNAAGASSPSATASVTTKA